MEPSRYEGLGRKGPLQPQSARGASGAEHLQASILLGKTAAFSLVAHMRVHAAVVGIA